MSQPGGGSPVHPPAGGEGAGRATPPPPARPLAAGDPARIGPYRLEGVLGAGGMGRVYLGRTPAGTAVAVKVVHREYAGDRSFRRRFAQEVAAARRVQGLYTVPVVDADLEADEPWLATAYVPGPSLDDAVADHGPLPFGEALALTARVAEALQSIHAAGVIHRDLKPSNIVLTAEGPKVIDFGIARAADVTALTGTGMLAGTPAYLAPEYIRGHSVTEAVDVFALGVVASFAATGTPAFGGGTPHSVTYRILEQEPDLDGCPGPVRTVAARCLAKDPRRRPTPAEVIELCHRAATAAGQDGPGHTVLSSSEAGTVSDSPVGLHDAVTAPAARPTAPAAAAGAARGETDGCPPDTGAPQAPAALHLAGAATPPPPVLLGGLGVVAAVAVLVAVLLPTGSGEPDTPVSRKPVATLRDFPKGVDGVAFSPDGEQFATAGGDGRVRLWDVADRTPRAAFTQRDASGEVAPASCVAFSPDGTLLAACMEYGGATLWDVRERRQVASVFFDEHDHDAIESMAFSPDGELLATAGDEGVRLWDARNPDGPLQERAVLDDQAYADEVAFSPDGRSVAAVGLTMSRDGRYDSDHWAKVWDVADHRERATLSHVEKVTNLAFSPDGERLATAGPHDTVKLWNMESGRHSGLHDDSVTELDGGLAFSPDGTRLAVAAGTTVRLWDMAEHEVRTDLVGHGENIAGVAFSPDGRLLVSCAYDGTVRLWKAR